ncbi:hypothetical protein NPIL_231971, partial [Nephila pilipes]
SNPLLETPVEVKQIIGKLVNKEAPGPNSIPSESNYELL